MKQEQTNKISDLDFSHYTGTEAYHYLSFLKNLKFTDGMKYLCDTAGAFWLADILTSVQYLPKIKNNKEFIVWSITSKDNEGVVKAFGEDDEGNKVTLYTQKIPYTDFPEGEFEFFQCGDVALLRGEY